MLKQRIITALILLPIALGGFFLLEGGDFALFIGFVVTLGAWEWARLAGLMAQPLRIAYDVVGAPAFLVQYSSDLRVAQERMPDIQFHAMREHSGRVFGAAPTL